MRRGFSAGRRKGSYCGSRKKRKPKNMRCKQKIDELIYQDGRSLRYIEFLIRDGDSEKVVRSASPHGRSYLTVLNSQGEYVKVPYHRVQAILINGETVWEKRGLRDE